MARDRCYSHKLDDGDLRVEGVPMGDGYYSVTCTCRVCGDDATRTQTVSKSHLNGIKTSWFQKHQHD